MVATPNYYGLHSMCIRVSICQIMSCMGIYQELWIRSEREDCGLQVTVGHCCRSKDEPISRLHLWKRNHCKRKAERLTFTYVDLLKQDTALEETDMKIAMLDRHVWRAITVQDVSTLLTNLKEGLNLIFG